MVEALGGPADFVERADHYLPAAPVQREVCAARSGWVQAVATRDIGLLVIELGGGRRQASDAIDHRVGFDDVIGLGARVERGQRLAVVHAADEAGAELASARLLDAITIGDAAPSTIAQLISAWPVASGA